MATDQNNPFQMLLFIAKLCKLRGGPCLNMPELHSPSFCSKHLIKCGQGQTAEIYRQKIEDLIS